MEKLDTWGKEMRKLVMNGEKFTVKPFKLRKWTWVCQLFEEQKMLTSL